MKNTSSKKHGKQVSSGDLAKYSYYEPSSGKGTFESPFDPNVYIHIAKDLGYPPIVIEELKKCKNHIQATTIMKGARNGEYG